MKSLAAYGATVGSSVGTSVGASVGTSVSPGTLETVGNSSVKDI